MGYRSTLISTETSFLPSKEFIAEWEEGYNFDGMNTTVFSSKSECKLYDNGMHLAFLKALKQEMKNQDSKETIYFAAIGEDGFGLQKFLVNQMVIAHEALISTLEDEEW